MPWPWGRQLLLQLLAVPDPPLPLLWPPPPLRRKTGKVVVVAAINNASITTADVKAGSNVLQVIDKVLLPTKLVKQPNIIDVSGHQGRGCSVYYYSCRLPYSFLKQLLINNKYINTV